MCIGVYKKEIKLREIDLGAYKLFLTKESGFSLQEIILEKWLGNIWGKLIEDKGILIRSVYANCSWYWLSIFDDESVFLPGRGGSGKHLPQREIYALLYGR